MYNVWHSCIVSLTEYLSRPDTILLDIKLPIFMVYVYLGHFFKYGQLLPHQIIGLLSLYI